MTDDKTKGDPGREENRKVVTPSIEPFDLHCPTHYSAVTSDQRHYLYETIRRVEHDHLPGEWRAGREKWNELRAELKERGPFSLPLLRCVLETAYGLTWLDLPSKGDIPAFMSRTFEVGTPEDVRNATRNSRITDKHRAEAVALFLDLGVPEEQARRCVPLEKHEE